ncbi:MAG: sigma-54-dependent Fis family transcriptional regulator [Bdellovibrionaceae bacterium]|nr:sigma-54-dependent Fis family transcriptional regulator [Pseudobdellovibrionaceae bacterium]
MSKIITNDRRMKEVIQLAETVSQSKATVLIQGESGTGKEVLASMIHSCSTRKNKPFVAINCAAIPENLLESELFGYERGAFTGAASSKAGKFEFANNGTLLLDEISEMDLKLQAKLLRVIQESEVDRIGGRKPIPIDVRIVATTNKNLAECVKEGTFREDLFYRLNVVNLTLPPLRERIGDVEILSEYFISKLAAKNNSSIKKIDIDALKKLDSHLWPGNVRELENVIERALITAGEVILVNDIVLQNSLESQSMRKELVEDNEMTSWIPGKTLHDIEREIIIKALDHHSGNRTHTAKALGISIRTLRNKIAEYKKVGIYL